MARLTDHRRDFRSVNLHLVGDMPATISAGRVSGPEPQGAVGPPVAVGLAGVVMNVREVRGGRDREGAEG